MNDPLSQLREEIVADLTQVIIEELEKMENAIIKDLTRRRIRDLDLPPL